MSTFLTLNHFTKLITRLILMSSLFVFFKILLLETSSQVGTESLPVSVAGKARQTSEAGSCVAIWSLARQATLPLHCTIGRQQTWTLTCLLMLTIMDFICQKSINIELNTGSYDTECRKLNNLKCSKVSGNLIFIDMNDRLFLKCVPESICVCTGCVWLLWQWLEDTG